jgi:hypothetical protein
MGVTQDLGVKSGAIPWPVRSSVTRLPNMGALNLKFESTNANAALLG